VLVRESWQSQVVACMWAAGIPRSAAEALIGAVDACRLDATLDALERAGTRDSAAAAAISAIARSSGPVVTYRFPSGAAVRLDRERSVLAPRCGRRLADDAAGVWPLAPLVLARGGANVCARDLHGRDTLLLEQYPERAVYLPRPSSGDPETSPGFYPVWRDSVVEEARGEEGERF
jgi:hypothetical protein